MSDDFGGEEYEMNDDTKEQADDGDENALDEENGDDMAQDDEQQADAVPAALADLGPNELPFDLSMGLFDTGRTIAPLDATEEAQMAATNEAKEWYEKFTNHIKEFALDEKATAAAAAAAAQQPEAAAEEVGDEAGNEDGEGKAKGGKAKGGSRADNRVFKPSPAVRTMPVFMLETDPKDSLVKYLRPDTPKDTKTNTYLSPASVRYKNILPSQLPLHDCALSHGKATSQEVAYAVQRVGEKVVIGSASSIGAIITFPGHCSADFGTLPVIDCADDLAKLQEIGKSCQTVTRDVLANAAVCAAFTNGVDQSSDFLRVQPIRIKLASYVALLNEQLDSAQRSYKTAPKPSTKRTIDEMEHMLKALRANAPIVAAAKGCAWRDLVLRLFAYNVFAREAVFAATPQLFPSIIQTTPPGKKAPTTPAETLAKKRAENLRFLLDCENRTYVEFTACILFYSAESPEPLRIMVRFILRVPIIPTNAWFWIKDEYKLELAEIQKGKATAATPKKQKTAATAAESAPATSTPVQQPPAKPPKSKPAPPPPPSTNGNVEPTPTEEDITKKLTSATTQTNVKKRSAESAGAPDKIDTKQDDDDAGDEVTVLSAAAVLQKASAAKPTLKKKQQEEVLVLDDLEKKTTTPAKAAPKTNGVVKAEPKTAVTAVKAEPKKEEKAVDAAVVERTPEQQFVFDKMCQVVEIYDKLDAPDKDEVQLGAWANFEIPETGKIADAKRKENLKNTYQTLRAMGLPSLLLDQRKREQLAAAIAAAKAAEAEAAAKAAKDKKNVSFKPKKAPEPDALDDI